MIREIAGAVRAQAKAAKLMLSKVETATVTRPADVDAKALAKGWSSKPATQPKTASVDPHGQLKLPLAESVRRAGAGFRLEGRSVVYAQQPRESAAQALVRLQSFSRPFADKILDLKDGTKWRLSPYGGVEAGLAEPLTERVIADLAAFAKELRNPARVRTADNVMTAVVNPQGRLSVGEVGQWSMGENAAEALKLSRQLGREVGVLCNEPALTALPDASRGSRFILDSSLKDLGATAARADGIQVNGHRVGVRLPEGTLARRSDGWRFFPVDERDTAAQRKLLTTLQRRLGEPVKLAS